MDRFLQHKSSNRREIFDKQTRESKFTVNTCPSLAFISVSVDKAVFTYLHEKTKNFS